MPSSSRNMTRKDFPLLLSPQTGFGQLDIEDSTRLIKNKKYASQKLIRGDLLIWNIALGIKFL
jgi:hypothetical protein